MDQITILTAVSDINGTPSKKQMNKFVYSDGQSTFNAQHMWFSVEAHNLKNLGDVFSLLNLQTRETRKTIVRGAYSGASPNFTQRRNTNFDSVSHHWVCLDIDTVKAPIGVDPTSLDAVEIVVQSLPKVFHDADYIAHFSSSAGTEGQFVKVHIWFWLKNPLKDEILKIWAKSTNKLVDHTLFQKVQQHFICDPTFQDPTMDKFLDRERLHYVKKSRESVPLVVLENTPSPSKRSFRRTGGIVHVGFNIGEAMIHPKSGKALNGRESLHLRIRYHLMKMGYSSFPQFCDDAWQKFCEHAETYPTEYSTTHWTREKSDNKCQQDRDKLATHAGGNVQIPSKYLTKEQAQHQLITQISKFLEIRTNVAIKAAAGLGKSKGVRLAIAKHPDASNLSIEVYVPTKDLAREFAEDFDPSVRVSVYRGRDEENCPKYELAQKIGAFGGGVQHKLCCNKSGESCEFWGSCGWSTQNSGPSAGVRVMAHSYLSQIRPEQFPKPDLVIVDESILNQIVGEWTFSADRIWNMSGMERFRLDIRGSGPATIKHPNEQINNDDWDDLYAIGQQIRGAITHSLPLLRTLRESGYSRDDLLRAACVVDSFMPYLNIQPGMDETQIKTALRRGDSRGIKSFQWLSKFYNLLADEIEQKRPEARGLYFSEDICTLLYKNDLPRLEGVPVLFIDADLEPEILRKVVGEIDVTTIDVRFNAKVYKVTDRAFSKSEVGLVGGNVNQDLVENLISFVASQKRPESTLVVTYIELQEILTGERKGFSKMACGATVGHFGNIRGIDSFKNFETVIVIGRNKPPAHVIGQKQSALSHDTDAPESQNLASAIYRAMVTSETNQAVARLRLIWCDQPKTVFLLSNENVSFEVQHEMKWDELLAGGGRLFHLVQRFGTFPLIDSWLFDNASDLFNTKTAAKKWIENNFPPGAETGIFRVKGKGGPRPSRFYSGETEIDPAARLEDNLNAELIKYRGPERGVFLNGYFYRELTRHPEIQPLIDMGLIAGPRLPEP